MDALVEPDEAITSPPWGEFGRAFTLGMVSLLGKLTLQVANTTEVQQQNVFLQQVLGRPAGEGLISVSNHTSTLDDPFVISAMLPWSYFWTEYRHKGNRWALCAREICFKNELFSQFFRNGKVLPIERGRGLDQPIMQVAAQRVRQGDWVHVFPEGRVYYHGTMGRFKWGIGKMVCDCTKDGKRPPAILPFYHSGMGWVMPKRSILPRFFNRVTVTVGQPVDVSDLTPRCNRAGEDQQEVWQDITARIEQALRELEAQAPANRVQRSSRGGTELSAEPLYVQDPTLPKVDPAAKGPA